MSDQALPTDAHENATASGGDSERVTHGGEPFVHSRPVLLVVFAALRGEARHVVSYAIFGSSLIILYTMSTLYHSMTIPGQTHPGGPGPLFHLYPDRRDIYGFRPDGLADRHGVVDVRSRMGPGVVGSP
jgi:hypothetical protein